MPTINAQFPEKLQVLFQPKRYKVLYGGRGAGRSWGIARALLAIGSQRAIRVLCVRELQNSIAESVHKVLTDQIFELGLSSIYKIEVARISCVSGPGKGTVFTFEGIKNNTTKIKSYEGIDYCWVEEAVKVSRTSWKILIPTIRKEVCPNGHKQPPAVYSDFADDEPTQAVCGECGAEMLQSEIWMSFNPELETDYTYVRFVLQANKKNTVVVKMTHADNPWFPRVLRDEMLEDKRNDPDAYLNTWEGHTLQNLEGAVYAKELRRATEERRICRVPWERTVPVDTFWDLGRADSTCIWFTQRVAMQHRVLAYFEGQGEEISYYLKECQSREYVYGTMHLPHDARAVRLGSKKTIEERVRAVYPSTRVLPKASLVDGINAARAIFPNCWFDEIECADGLKSLRHYRYRVIDGQLSAEPLHDWSSDGADGFRYFAIGSRNPKPKRDWGSLLGRKQKGEIQDRPGQGWMGQ